MKISALTAQASNINRVNVFIDNKYRFSLDIFQVTELGLKVGDEIDGERLKELEQASAFGKLYARALEYTMLRPHSAREMRDYLWRKTQATKYRSKGTGEIKQRDGVAKDVADQVFARLSAKGYIDDERFTRYWVENRNQVKGMSLRKLTAELRAKGVDQALIATVIGASERNDLDEIRKIIVKKGPRYSDKQKLIAYLARQGFSYDDIKTAIEEDAQ